MKGCLRELELEIVAWHRITAWEQEDGNQAL